jgi:hypothetical protein
LGTRRSGPISWPLAGARKLAAGYGYEVLRVAPLDTGELLTADYRYDRLDVECSGISEDSIVVAYKGKKAELIPSREPGASQFCLLA